MNTTTQHQNNTSSPPAFSEWAADFLQQLAAGWHENLHSLAGFSDEQHQALAEIACEGFASRAAKVRAAAAWITGELRFPPTEALSLLVAHFRDRAERVRRACAWAAGKQPAHASLFAVPLAAAVDDPSETVRFGALHSLELLGPACQQAVPRLLALTRSENELHRSMAASALAAIAPEQGAVKERLMELLSDGDASTRQSATLGVGRSATKDPTAAKRIAQMLSDDNREVRLFAVEARRQLETPQREAVIALLELMAREEWYFVTPSFGEQACRIHIRSDLTEALEKAVESINDETLADFRLLFFNYAFRDDHATVQEQAELLAHHDFVEKVIRKRLGEPKSNADRDLFEQFVKEAQEKFAQRLRNIPTLRLPADEYHDLHKWIRTVSRTIVGNLWRSLKRARASAARQRRPKSGSLDLATIERKEVVDQIFAENRPSLTEEERLVASLHFIGGHTLTAVAAMLGLSESQVKTRRTKAREKIARWFARQS